MRDGFKENKPAQTLRLNMVARVVPFECSQTRGTPEPQCADAAAQGGLGLLPWVSLLPNQNHKGNRIRAQAVASLAGSSHAGKLTMPPSLLLDAPSQVPSHTSAALQHVATLRRI